MALTLPAILKMSGQAAIRGFTYQTIISVIHSLTDDDWEFVQVEPDTSNDKVDILWETADDQTRCQQVKSSIRNFSKTDVIAWLEKMIADVPSASQYELTLIGNVATGTDVFINDINKGKPTESSAVVDAELKKIKVTLIVFSIDFLESKVRDEVSKYLSVAGYHLPHSTIHLITGGLIYQFFQFSVLGVKVSRLEFSEHLMQWIKFNYGRDLGIETKRSKFSVLFYNNKERDFKKILIPFKPRLNHHPLTDEFRSKAMEKYRIANSIKLPKRVKPPSTDQPRMTALTGFLRPNGLSDSDIPHYQKELINEKMKEYFQITINNDFYNTGNLKQSFALSPLPFGGGYSYTGTDEEKKKRESVQALYWELETIKELKSFIEFFNSHYVMCLAVENSGSSFDEEITVNVLFPKHVDLIKPEDFYIPDDIDALDILIKKESVRNILRIEADSLITDYIYDPFINFDSMNELDLIYRLHNGDKRRKLKKDKLLHQIESRMNFEVL
jgi:hypothetical protein